MATITSGYDSEFPPLAPPSQQQGIISSEIRRATPPVPPGLEQHILSESRRSTPTIPPGFSRPTALPDLESPIGSRPSSRASMKRAVSQIMPAVPLRPATPIQRSVSKAGPSVHEAKVGDKGDPPQTPTPASKQISNPAAAKINMDPRPATPKVESKITIPKRAVPDTSAPSTEDTVSKADSSKPLAPPENVEQTETTSTSTSKTASAPRTLNQDSKSLATVQTSKTEAISETPVKSQAPASTGTKRTPPGKLDIAAASSPAIVADAGTPSSAQRSILQTPVDAKSESPVGSISSPAIRGPKTLRVVQTPRTETPPAIAAGAPAHPTPSAVRLPSRQPSIASIQMPGTPSSEHISLSDNISMPSTSQSRANSPPPTAGGKSSLAATKTKNQLKKERQERAKAMEEEKKLEVEKKAPSEEPAQEAIVSRKKKTKKEKEPKIKAPKATPAPSAATQSSTPTASRASSPPPASISAPAADITRAQPEAVLIQQPQRQQPKSPPLPSTPPFKAPAIFHEPSPPPTPTFTAAQLIAELKATAPEIQKCIDSLFRSPTAHASKPATPITPRDLENELMRKIDLVPSLSPEEVDGLLKGLLPALRYGGADQRVWSRGMVTPTGAHLRALTEELEMRFLELERAIQDLPEELRFRPTKPQNELKFPALDLQALKRNFENVRSRGVNVMEQVMMMQQQQQQGDLTTRGGGGGVLASAPAAAPPAIVDEVGRYINEFVMPPATPPPNTGGAGSAGSGGGVGGRYYDGSAAEHQQIGGGPGVDLAERQLGEARRVVEEREGALKKMMKKNRKALGLGA